MIAEIADDLLTCPEVMALSGLSQTPARRLMHRVGAVKLHGSLRVRRSPLVAYLALKVAGVVDKQDPRKPGRRDKDRRLKWHDRPEPLSAPADMWETDPSCVNLHAVGEVLRAGVTDPSGRAYDKLPARLYDALVAAGEVERHPHALPPMRVTVDWEERCGVGVWAALARLVGEEE